MINSIINRQVIGQPTPVVGMGATILYVSDRYAGTIIEVQEKNGYTIVTVQEDNATVTNKMGGTGAEEYEFSANPNGRISHFRFKENGSAWESIHKNPETGRWIKSRSSGLSIGHRSAYRDPHF